jgi:2-oxoglutarate ferredoxin oxidoreductase subunit alpha
MSGKKVLLSGNDAISNAAIRSGCRFYAGYPITPQNEIPAYMAKHMPEAGGVFIQAESELAAINMVFGASSAGARAMTSSSSPGISLKQEGLSYIAAAELPAVVVNMMRAGPGLGNIWPSQADYFQATKGGGHGDYHLIVLAPSTVQEAFEHTHLAFDLADKYRNPVMILGDGLLGQIIEPVNTDIHFIASKESKKEKKWALTGAKKRKPNIIRSLFMNQDVLEKHNLKLQEKYRQIQENEIRFEEYLTKDAEFIIVSYGTMARIVKDAVLLLRKENIKVGLFRPVSLWPFPYADLSRTCQKVKNVLVVEMSYGQMIEDVKLALCERANILFLGRSGGGIPSVEDIARKIKELSGSISKKKQ